MRKQTRGRREKIHLRRRLPRGADWLPRRRRSRRGRRRPPRASSCARPRPRRPGPRPRRARPLPAWMRRPRGRLLLHGGDYLRRRRRRVRLRHGGTRGLGFERFSPPIFFFFTHGCGGAALCGVGRESSCLCLLRFIEGTPRRILRLRCL